MNTLTGLIPVIYASLNVVSREMIGFIPAVTMDTNLAERAAVGQTVRASVAPMATSNDVTASMNIPQGDDQAIGKVDMTITHSKAVQIPWPGEDQLSIKEGPGQSIFAQQMQEAFRHLSSLVEGTVAANYVKASRAYGTAGTIPFGSGVGDAAQIRKLLIDNGARGDLRLVVGTAAGANLRTNTQLTKANESGTDDTLRSGSLLDLAGIKVHESAETVSHTAGDASGFAANGAASVGDTSVDVDGGTGTNIAGDIITFDGNASSHVVSSSTASTRTLGAPGLMQDVADDASITTGGNYEANMAFARSAIVLSARAPAVPEGGDAAVDTTMVVDPISGLTFEISVYLGYKKKMIEVAIAWGTQVVKPEHSVLLLG